MVAVVGVVGQSQSASRLIKATEALGLASGGTAYAPFFPDLCRFKDLQTVKIPTDFAY